ncbi:ImmA/IrrE family metallo-endopeptidase [Oceanibaculum pacificum]|uniref:IrrE N-terminal-like domain-containing protein n=1 Tax=Oceanibaculum pacificum TaxID=580166 RepID=A0A154W1D2_9PROT|nr:ImmA/IrrE family metallo-endopeptidase [Oceanibaculum pacificum]KZD07364.1 hypothetical protein AUP43_02250 [Oceanibaculum pacificum]
MTERLSPQRWANTLTTLLNSAFGDGPDRFPVNVGQLAKDYSHQRFPDDPVTLVQGDALSNFDGALYRAPAHKKGWGIIYNNAVRSPGRINFTLAHEFGHYLLHRQDHPDGIECSQQDMLRWDSDYARMEQQANEFAATLLMPLDDFRRQLEPRAKPSLDDIGSCADRYRVSLIAATLRWLQYTERRSVLVLSREGFILWARSSPRALKTGVFFRTANRPPVPVPATSLPMQPDYLDSSKGTVEHDAGVWFAEPCQEIALLSDHYDFAISLIHLDDAAPRYSSPEAPEDEENTYDRMINRTPGSSWFG